MLSIFTNASIYQSTLKVFSIYHLPNNPFYLTIALSYLFASLFNHNFFLELLHFTFVVDLI